MSRRLLLATFMALAAISLLLGGVMIYWDFKTIPEPIEGNSDKAAEIVQNHPSAQVATLRETIGDAQAALLTGDDSLLKTSPEDPLAKRLALSFEDSLRVEQDTLHLAESVAGLVNAIGTLDQKDFESLLTAMNKLDHLSTIKQPKLANRINTLLDNLKDERLNNLALERATIGVAINRIYEFFRGAKPNSAGDYQACIDLCSKTLAQIKNIPLSDARYKASETRFLAMEKRDWIPIGETLAQSEQHLLGDVHPDTLQLLHQYVDFIGKDEFSDFRKNNTTNFDRGKRASEWNRLIFDRLKLGVGALEPNREISLDGVVPADAINELHFFYQTHPGTSESAWARDLAAKILFSQFIKDEQLTPHESANRVEITIRRTGRRFEGHIPEDDAEQLDDDIVTLKNVETVWPPQKEPLEPIRYVSFFETALTGPPKLAPDPAAERIYKKSYLDLEKLLQQKGFAWNTEAIKDFVNQCAKTGLLKLRVIRQNRAKSLENMVRESPAFNQ